MRIRQIVGLKFKGEPECSDRKIPVSINVDLMHFDKNRKTVDTEFYVGSIIEDIGYYQELASIGSNKAFQQEILKELFNIHRLVKRVDPKLSAENRSVILAELAERSRTLEKILNIPYNTERIINEFRRKVGKSN